MKPLQSERGKRPNTPGEAVRRRNAAIALTLLLVGLPALILGQDRMPPQQRELLASVPRGLPSDLLLQVQALGSRMRLPGKEETILSGQLFDAAGNPKTVRVVHQISGMIRIEGLRENIPLTFDGDFSQGISDRSGESLLETFVMDTVEGMIYSVRSGDSMRLLGRRFSPDARGIHDYKGPRYDIYEIIAPVRTRQDRQLRFKRYYFDSDTGFLLSTRYTDPTVSSGIRVETRFSNWQQVDGSAYPGRIDRYENGTPVFSFVVATASSQPRQKVTQSQ